MRTDQQSTPVMGALGEGAPMTTPSVCDTLVVQSGSVADTQAVGAALVPLLRAGDVVLLGGDLGAGKTALTQGLARAAGVDEVVTSPTFTLLRSYRTGIGADLLHADVYRLEQLSEVVDLGLPEQLEDGAFAVIEWGERAAAALGPEALHITIDIGPGDGERTLTVRPGGAAWEERWPALTSALAPGTPA
ncbi:MAG: tRNA (adenosine(37)-N6)-threonylcarbamoyltransferase complex ATPase subunit type 1 TsaE [Acidimicrobiales bacterium]